MDILRTREVWIYIGIAMAEKGKNGDLNAFACMDPEAGRFIELWYHGWVSKRGICTRVTFV